MESYKLVNRLPSLVEYHNICAAVGWEKVINFDVAQISLNRSVFSVVVEHADVAVGMGRIVGDGAIYFYIQDIAVKPAHQGQGLGQRIMEHLMAWISENAPDLAFVALFAAEGTEPFYERYGFRYYEQMKGMFQTAPLASPESP